VSPRAGLDVCENLVPTGIRSPDRPARSQSLYRLSYPGPNCQNILIEHLREAISVPFDARTLKVGGKVPSWGLLQH
jgi:hypothetical protein